MHSWWKIKRENLKKTIALSLMFTFLLTGILGNIMVTAKAKENINERIELNFNTGWKFYRGDVKGAENVDFYDDIWEVVNLPHTLRLEPRSWKGTSPAYQGIGWYRRDFTLGESLKGKKVFVEFEGAMGNTEVWINGENVTKHYGGYLPFTVDISEFVNFDGNNVIAVKVDNTNDPQTPPGKPQNGLDFFYYGGLYRNVNMYVTDKVYVTDSILADKVADGGVFVTYPEVSKEKAIVNVTTNVKNDHNEAKNCTVTTEIIDENNNIVATNTTEGISIEKNTDYTFEQSIEVLNPNLWTTYDPNLYALKTIVNVNNEEIDIVTTKIGIRRIEFTSDKGFFINGEHIFLNGVNRHQEYLYIGNAAPDSLQYKDAKQIKDAGFNMVRTGHYPPSKSFLDACDELGIVVIEPVPGWQNFGDEVFQERTIQAIREMVRRDRNHPSIVLWESSLNETWMSKEFAQAAYDATHEEYPGDQCYAASDYTSYGKEIYDVNYKEIDTADKPLLTREWGDEWSEKADSPEGYRSVRSVGELDMINSSYSRQNALNGNGYFDWCGLNANERISGYALWSYNDYNRGTENDTAYSGIVDRDRYEKFNYYYLQSQRDPNLIQEGVDSGPMVFIANYWTENSPKDVSVYSNCEEVNLYLNDKLIETRKPDSGFDYIKHPTFTFNDVPWEAGNLRAEGVIDGEVVATYEVNTPKSPHYIEIEFATTEKGFVADGSDVVIAYATVRDEDGNIIPGANDSISLHLSGNGKLIGNGEARVKANPVEATDGIAPIFIQSSLTPGDITITATAHGLEAGTATITTTEVNEKFVPGEVSEENSSIHGKNLALNMPITASSEKEEKPATNANDGEISTGWNPSNSGADEWIKVDLGENKNILGVELNWSNQETSNNYIIEVSQDDNQWIPLINNEGNSKNSKEHLYKFASDSRYVRLRLLDESSNYADLYEFIVYGSNNTEDDSVGEEERINVALGKEAFASSYQEGKEPTMANDGDTGSMWRAETDGVEWLTIDLGKFYNLTGSKILWGKDSIYYSYKIEVSDDNENWTEVVKALASGQNMLPDNFDAKWARYVRVTIDKLNGGVLEVPAIREIEVYGKDIEDTEKIPQNQITVKTNSEETIDRDNKAANTLDGVRETMWHSQWTPSDKKLPQHLILDLGGSYTVSEVKYLPRQSGSTNGRILQYNVYVSDDGLNYTLVEENGVWDNNITEKTTAFDPVKASYIKLECINGLGDFASAAEVNVYEIDDNDTVSKIPQENMTASASSEELVGDKNGASNVLDGDINTIWHTSWTSGGLPEKPYYLTFDLGGSYSVNELRYLPRQDGNSNGDIYKYNIYVSEDGVNFEKIEEEGSWAKNKEEKKTNFSPINASFIKLEVVDSYGGHASASEINIFKSLIDIIETQTTVGKEPQLPEIIDVKLDSETTKKGIALWEEIDPSLYEEEGEFVVNGLIKDTDIKIQAYVTVVKEDVNKEELNDLINEARELYANATEGFEVGEYHKGAKENLMASIESANRVYENNEAINEEVKEEVENLKASIELFRTLIISETTGDLNKNNKIDIGDLSLVSKHYNKNNVDNKDQWDILGNYDINKDGVIGDYDLEFVSYKILNN